MFYELHMKCKDRPVSNVEWFDTEAKAAKHVNLMDMTPFEFCEIIPQMGDEPDAEWRDAFEKSKHRTRFYDNKEAAKRFKEAKEQDRAVVGNVTVFTNVYGKSVCNWKEARWYEI